MKDVDRWRNGSWWEDAILRRTAPPYGPINTVTNLAYLLAGACAFWLLGDPVLAAALVWLGIGSGLYHCFKTGLTSALDESGMYSVFAYLVLPTWYMAGLGALLGLVVYWPGWTRGLNLTHAMVLLGAIALAFAGFAGLWSVPFFGAAYLLWIGDQRRWDNDANSQTTPWYARLLHGAWHVLTAAGIYLLASARLAQ